MEDAPGLAQAARDESRAASFALVAAAPGVSPSLAMSFPGTAYHKPAPRNCANGSLSEPCRPMCIWRTTEITVKPLVDVDDAFAWDEGEGERTRAWWLSAHRSYFSGQAQREGFEMRDAIETVFERFEVVWPPEVVDLVL